MLVCLITLGCGSSSDIQISDCYLLIINDPIYKSPEASV